MNNIILILRSAHTIKYNIYIFPFPFTKYKSTRPSINGIEYCTNIYIRKCFTCERGFELKINTEQNINMSIVV